MSIPGPAQWVRDPAMPQPGLPLWLGSDPWPGSSICHSRPKEGEKKKKKKSGEPRTLCGVRKKGRAQKRMGIC